MITRDSFEKVVNALDLDITVEYIKNGNYWGILIPDPEERDEYVLLAKLYVEDLTLDIVDINTEINICERFFLCGGIEYYIKENDISACSDINTCKYGCHDKCYDKCDDVCNIYHILTEKELFGFVIDLIREYFNSYISELNCKLLSIHESLDILNKEL